MSVASHVRTPEGLAVDNRRSPAQPAERIYRDDITGLRAIAVVAVLLFHLRIPGFEGGYVGVDIFFVISGFLITGMIWRDVEASKFSLEMFFIRRARRLLPAAIATIGATFVAGALVLGPNSFSRLATSTIWSTLGLSNIYFWSESGYFDTAAGLKPLLHTWSLSVEWQFYWVWPLILMVAWSRRDRLPPLAVIVGIGVSSLFLNLAFESRPSTIYFLPWFRAFEFAIGAAIVWLIRFEPNAAVKELASLFGIALIVASATFYSEETIFPSVAALAPCVGTALLIWARQSPFVGNALVSRPMVLIGEASYSIYLVHWPLIVFCRHTYQVTNWQEKGALLLASLMLGWLLYRLVEQRYRYARGPNKFPPRKFAAATAACLIIVIAPAAHVRLSNGWSWRINSEIRDLLTLAALDEGARRINRGCFLDTVREVYFRDFKFDDCMAPQPGRINALLLGDSIAAYALPGIVATSGPRYHIMQNFLTGCPPLIGTGREQQCLERNRDFFENHERAKPNTVILMAHWREEHLADIRKTVAALRSKGVHTVLVGPTLRFDKPLYDIVSSAGSVQEATIGARFSIDPAIFTIDQAMAQIAKQEGVSYYSILERLCPERRKDGCRVLTEQQVMFSTDQWHLLPSAAVYVFKDLSLRDHGS